VAIDEDQNNQVLLCHDLELQSGEFLTFMHQNMLSSHVGVLESSV
jgi:hypothetical protein